MRVIGIDIETTGLDPERDEILEVACVVKDIGDPKPFHIEHHFIKNSEIEISEEIYSLTRITTNHLSIGIYLDVLSDLLNWVINQYHPDFIVAHNGEAFDKPFIYKKIGSVWDEGLPWFDTKIDLKFPKACKQTNLMYLAAYYGFLNPFPHSALFDVMTMLNVLECNLRSSTDSIECFEMAKTPFVKIKAEVGFQNRQLAKERGYSWDADQKIWTKMIRQGLLKREEEGSPFLVTKI